MSQPMKVLSFLLLAMYAFGIVNCATTVETLQKSLDTATSDLQKAGKIGEEGKSKLAAIKTDLTKVDEDIKSAKLIESIQKQMTTKDDMKLQIIAGISQGIIGGIDDFVKGHQTKSPTLYLKGAFLLNLYEFINGLLIFLYT